MIIIAIYVAAAVLPAIFLLRYINRMDRVEKEPAGLLISLLLMGVCAAAAASVLEGVGMGLIPASLDVNSPEYAIVLAFLVVGAAEEGAKLFFLKLRSWRSPAFNYRFDGVVYAVFVSLGFAALENIGYVLGYGLSVAIPRALLAVPAHMGFAVFMGSYYGRAKVCHDRGDEAGARANLRRGYLLAVVLHGFYDACAMIESALSSVLFFGFVVVMYVVVIRRIKREADEDAPVGR